MSKLPQNSLRSHVAINTSFTVLTHSFHTWYLLEDAICREYYHNVLAYHTTDCQQSRAD